MRRRIAFAAATTLASTAVLVAAPLASAEPTPPPSASASGSPSASASVSASDTGAAVSDKKSDATPQVRVQGVPSKVVAGGDAALFTVTITNNTATDIYYVPFVQVSNDLKNPNGVLQNNGFDLQFRRPKAKDWQPTNIPAGIPTFLNNPHLLGPVDDQGQPTDGSVYFLKVGQSLSFKMKLNLPADAPLGSAQASFVTLWSGTVDGQPSSTLDQFAISKPDWFCIVKPKPTPPTPSQSVTSSPPATSSTTPPPPVTPTGSKSSSNSGPVGTPSPSDSTAPTTFPVAPPKPVTLPVAPGAAQVAVSDALADQKSLAFTGGGSDATPIAIGGAAAVALGVGTLVALRRRKSGGAHA